MSELSKAISVAQQIQARLDAICFDCDNSKFLETEKVHEATEAIVKEIEALKVTADKFSGKKMTVDPITSQPRYGPVQRGKIEKLADDVHSLHLRSTELLINLSKALASLAAMKEHEIQNFATKTEAKIEDVELQQKSDQIALDVERREKEREEEVLLHQRAEVIRLQKAQEKQELLKFTTEVERKLCSIHCI